MSAADMLTARRKSFVSHLSILKDSLKELRASASFGRLAPINGP